MLALRRHEEAFRRLEPPARRGSMTVADVVGCVDVEAHQAAVRAWARSALAAWATHRQTLDRWLDEALAAGPPP